MITPTAPNRNVPFSINVTEFSESSRVQGPSSSDLRVFCNSGLVAKCTLNSIVEKSQATVMYNGIQKTNSMRTTEPHGP